MKKTTSSMQCLFWRFLIMILFATFLTLSCNSGNSENTEPTSISAPTGLAVATQSESKINLYWNSVIGASSYNVYYGTSPSNDDAVFCNTSATHYSVSNLMPETEYYFWVTSVALDNTESEFSQVESVWTFKSSSSQPSTGEYNNAIILHAEYQYIYIWDSGKEKLDKKESEMNSESDGWYRFEIESDSAKFIFKPNAGDDWDGQSNELQATTGEWWYKDGKLYSSKPNSGSSSSGNTEPTSISAPTGLTATTQSESKINLYWNSVIGASSYNVYCGVDFYDIRYIGNVYNTSCVATDLDSSTTYYFLVRAVASNGTESKFSEYTSAKTYASSSSGNEGSSGGSSTTTNDLLSDVTDCAIFTQPIISKKVVLTDNKKGFYISLSNSSDMNASYYILYRSKISKTDLSAFEKIKTVSKSSSIAFEDFDVSFSKNDAYYYIVVAADSKNDTIGTMSKGLSIVLDKTRLYFYLTDKKIPEVTKKYTLDGRTHTLTFKRGTADKSKFASIEPGIHTITGIITNYDFLPLEYRINLTSRTMSTTPTLSSSYIEVFDLN